MLSRRFVVLVLAGLGCGRQPMGVPGRDGARVEQTPDATVVLADGVADGVADAVADGVGDPPPDLPGPTLDDAGDASDAAATSDAARVTDGCVPLTCKDPGCYPAYCGDIGDGCGATLHCGDCPAGSVCLNRQCFLIECLPTTCYNTTAYAYCGIIGNGCGETLHCACPDLNWTCDGHICVPAGCVPIAGCTGTGWEYCGGRIGDGCGRALDCYRECSRPGAVCRDNVCHDPGDAGASGPPPPPAPPLSPLPPPPPPPPCPPPPPAPTR
jgi:hypothetical protein